MTCEQQSCKACGQPVPFSVKFYVSSAKGDDANDGLSIERPLQTVREAAKRMRDGSADWILLLPDEPAPASQPEEKRQ